MNTPVNNSVKSHEAQMNRWFYIFASLAAICQIGLFATYSCFVRLEQNVPGSVMLALIICLVMLLTAGLKSAHHSLRHNEEMYLTRRNTRALIR